MFIPNGVTTQLVTLRHDVLFITCSNRYLLNPSLVSEEHLLQYKFLGILLGVAIRTKKPLDLHLAPMVWKQLAGKRGKIIRYYEKLVIRQNLGIQVILAISK